MKTVELVLKQDYRLKGVLYREGPASLPVDVAVEAGLYQPPAEEAEASDAKPAAKKARSKKVETEQPPPAE